MRMTSCLFIILLVILAACRADVSDPVTVPPVTTAPEVVVATKTAVSPTTIPTMLPTSLPTFTATPPPTISPTPISPSAIPLPIYDLPAWINDPETAVLMAIMTFEPRSEGVIAFMNVNSGELFSFPLPPTTRTVRWGQDDKGTYFEFNHTHVVMSMVEDLYRERVYISTGESQKIQPENFTSYPNPSWIESPDSRFIARIIREDDMLNVILETVETTGRKMLIDPFYDNNPSYIVDMNWSSYGNLLSIGRYIRHGYNASDNGLTIYTQTGDVYRQFENKKQYTWSPVNNDEGLYVEDEDFGISLPCILDVQEGSDVCLDEIRAWREELKVQTGLYAWSYNGEQISFVYWREDRTSGLCFIEIDNRKIHCPIDSESLGGRNQDGEYNYIRRLPNLSPDRHYMQLTINPSPPGGDDGAFTRIVTADYEANNLQIWGYGYRASWRPSLPNNEE